MQTNNIPTLSFMNQSLQVLFTDDYFNDVNLRSLRRLKNIVYVTGRLLKSFQIEFNW